MVLTGVISKGVVILDNDGGLPEGTPVEVIVKEENRETSESGEPTLGGLLKFAGLAKGLPSDFAEQHDHYLHGTPKR
jgi:hypothetical protein